MTRKPPRWLGFVTGLFMGSQSSFHVHPSIFVAPMMPAERNDQVTAAGTLSVAPIASLTRGMTSFAINSMERFVSAGSTQSIPA